jgi:hypothetical protein
MVLIHSPIFITPLDGLVLKKVSRELQESLLMAFGTWQWDDRLLLLKTFGGENFIQDNPMILHGGTEDNCDLHSVW